MSEKSKQIDVSLVLVATRIALLFMLKPLAATAYNNVLIRTVAA